MDKEPIKLIDFINQQFNLDQQQIEEIIFIREQLYEFSKRCIEIQSNRNSWLRDSFCDICDCKLTIANEVPLSPYDFCRVCKKHEKYRNVFQINTIRERLGYKLYRTLE